MCFLRDIFLLYNEYILSYATTEDLRWGILSKFDFKDV